MITKQMNLTELDHLTWALTDPTDIDNMTTRWGTRKSDDQKFRFSVGQLMRRPKSWARELEIAMSSLVQTHGTKLALFYSGGSDSEIILRTLIKIGVVPEVHVIKFSSDLNAHETQHADELCLSLGVTPKVWHHDVEKYLGDNEYLDLGLKYQCTQIAYLTVLKYIQQVTLPAVMGGEIYLQRHQKSDGAILSDQEWYYVYREDEDGVTYRYSHATGHPLINEVMSYTPELIYTWLKQPTVSSVASNAQWGKITLLSVKRQAYEQELGYSLTARSKFHGYERLPWTNLKCRRDLRSRLPKMQVAKLEYQALLTHMETGVNECLT